MTESDRVVQVLKKQLRARGIHYQQVASTLGLSEASVKRLFANGGSLSLERLAMVCRLLEMDLPALFRLVADEREQLSALTWAQEEQLVADKALLLVAVCVTNGYRFEHILSQYNLSEFQVIQKLAQLDRLKVIELLPENRIKLKLSASFAWIPGGPIQQFFQQQVIRTFFRSDFAADDEKLMMSTGLMSVPSNHKFQQRMQKLVNEFYQACDNDDSLAMQERHGTSMIIAIRRWHFPLFEEFSTKE